MYRMQNTVDHTNISELTKIIGVECKSTGHEEKVNRSYGDSGATEAR